MKISAKRKHSEDFWPQFHCACTKEIHNCKFRKVSRFTFAKTGKEIWPISHLDKDNKTLSCCTESMPYFPAITGYTTLNWHCVRLMCYNLEHGWVAW